MLLGSHAAVAVCTTQSAGLNFSDSSNDISQSSYNVVNSCQPNPFTSNSACQNNLRCGDNNASFYPSGIVSCTASSRGLQFTQSGYDVNQASISVEQQCQSNPYTSNNECQNSLRCDDGGYQPPQSQVQCSTNSRGLNFNVVSSDTNSASTAVVSQCENNPYTNNNECVSNLFCQNSGYQPQLPVYPQPPQPYPPAPNQVSCSVTTRSGQYWGNGFDSGQATAAARDACLAVESSFACNAGSIVCRQ